MLLNLGKYWAVYSKMSAIIRIEVSGGVDIGVAYHVLFQNIVLYRAGELLQSHTLFFRGDDVEGHDRQDGAVHGH